MIDRLLLLGIVVLLGGVATAADPAVRPALATQDLLDFDLPGTEGGSVRPDRDSAVELHVVCFLGTECPLAQLYGPRLSDLAKRYAPRVGFIGIDPNQQDSMDELRAYGERQAIPFPLAKDHDQAITKRFGATRTPEVFVVDAAGKVRYRGRIDDQYSPGIARSEPTTHDLRTAIEQLLSKKTVAVPATDAVGCRIAPRRQPDPNSKVTFTDQVSRVLLRNCVECHRDDEIGPFALTDYDEVVGWADMILEVIDDGRMPPWHAAEGHTELANARQMSDSDRQVLHDWVDAGTPFGKASELPGLPERVAGWRLPNAPDVVFAMRDQPFAVPAAGTVEYQYFVVDPGFETDRWVSAAEVIPGNRRVVHHCIVFVRPPDGTDFREIGFLTAYVPGQSPTVLPAGYARRIRAGSQFVFQMHYTPTGTPQQDMTKVGLKFTSAESVTHEVLVTGGIEQDFEIPPHTHDFSVQGEVDWFPEHGELLAVAPHMHVRGKSFELVAERAGKSETLVRVPQYDFNWQHNYKFATPLPLASIDRLRFRCSFDNSAGNLSNPDPNQYVTWGDQTQEEMSVVFLQVARSLNAKSTVAKPDHAALVKQRAEREQQATAFAVDFIKRFDANGDQRVSTSEVPTAFREFQFRKTDRDGDGFLRKKELLRAARERF